VKKVSSENGFLKILLLYPNDYKTAISSLAWQSIYYLFNLSPMIQCHRAVLDFSDPLISLETGQPFSSYDIVAVHFSYELDYENFFRCLYLNNIPLKFTDRNQNYPLFIGGGLAVSIFPEMMQDYLDFIVTGEVEIFIEEFEKLDLNRGKNFKTDLKCQLSYFSNMHYKAKKQKTHKKILRNLDDYEIFTPIITRNGVFNESLLVELGRGCPCYCNFCAASFYHKPARFRSFASFQQIIESIDIRKAKRVGLVGASLGFYPHLKETLIWLYKKQIKASLSSIRIDRIDHEMVEMFDLHQIKTITVAPESGDENDRIAINKQLNQTNLLQGINLLSGSRTVQEIKLYFMIGFGFENEVEKLIKTVREILKISTKKITLSVNPFVPKKNTPFENKEFAKYRELKNKYKELRNQFAGNKLITLKLASLRESKKQYEYSNNPASLKNIIKLTH